VGHGYRRLVCGFAALTIAGSAQGQGKAQGSAQDDGTCRLDTLGTAAVRAVSDSRTLLLADGREVRLAGIETPGVGSAGAEPARAALQAFIAGREITLKRLGTETDRHGRVAAYAFVSGEVPSAQQALVAEGHARVGSRTGSPACAAPLLAAERAARTARLGLWADPYYGLRRAENPAEVLAEKGRFTLVEGKVLSVRESGATIYVNFGRRWSEDFTATVAKRSERAFTAAGLELKKLAGRTVRVRGFVEERGGPWIELRAPEQVEIAD